MFYEDPFMTFRLSTYAIFLCLFIVACGEGAGSGTTGSESAPTDGQTH